MYHRYNVSVAEWYNVCAAEAILDNCFTEFTFYGLLMISLRLHHWKKMGIDGKEGSLPVFDTGILDTFFFFANC